LLLGNQLDNVSRENFVSGALQEFFAHLIYGRNSAFEVVRIDDVIRILEQFAKAFFECGFILELLTDEFRLGANLASEQCDPRQSRQNEDHHSSREHEKVRQRPPGRSLKHVNVLGTSEH
jgi:hypothetical protein